MGKKTQDRNNWPWWVQLGLAGLPNRISAFVFFWISVLLAIGGAIGGFWNPLLFLGIGFLLAAWWYWAAIRWVDTHDGWG